MMILIPIYITKNLEVSVFGNRSIDPTYWRCNVEDFRCQGMKIGGAEITKDVSDNLRVRSAVE